ncbi:MAG TPA: cytochrome c biogenesis protein CcsA [Phycisphaerae bacterium]|nr:cytochrome c biogenesis protein CcsA [Phycisphaerae bacterium]
MPLLLLLLAALFLAAFLLALPRARRQPASPAPALTPTLGLPASLILAAATLLALALLVYRALAARSITLPLADHFDAFLLLALLLDAALLYLRWTRRFRSFALFLLPIIVILLILGAILTAVSPAPYPYDNVWTSLHIVSVIAGALCLALGCVGGFAYLLAHRQLKHAPATSTLPALPPLAAIERFNMSMVYAGFPLLTLAMITGALRLAQTAPPHSAHAPWLSPKLLFASAAWLTYAILAHVPLAPRLRGLHAAWLSILGFSLFLATYATVMWM